MRRRASGISHHAAAYYNARVPRARSVIVWMAAWAFMATAGVAQTSTVDPRVQPAIERLEATLAELGQLEASWLAFDKAEREKTARSREVVAVLEAEFAAAERRSDEVDALYDQVNPLVAWGLKEIGAAIDRARRPSPLIKYKQGKGQKAKPFGGPTGGLPESEAAEVLESLESEVRETVERLEELELRLRLDDVSRDLELAGRLYRLRLGLLRALSVERRRAEFAWARRAPEAVALELDASRMVGRYQIFQAQAFVAALGLKVKNLFTALLAGRLLVRLLVVLLLWRWVQRGRPVFIRLLRRKVRSVEDPQSQRWAGRLTDFVEALSPWAGFLIAVGGFSWAVGSDVFDIPLLRGVLALAVFYGLYRLATDLALGAVMTGMESTGMERSPDLQERLQRGVRWVMRMVAFVGFVLWNMSHRLGEGVLFLTVRKAGLVLVAAVLWLVLMRFRDEVREVFLALRAHGRLANLVRNSGSRASGALVTPLAFFWLCWRSVVGIVRGITFSFERTRSATAFMSRRQMAKVAEQRGSGAVALEDLPAGLVEALDEHLGVQDVETLDEFLSLDKARESAAAWREGSAGGSLLLAAEEGLGKGAWLDNFLALEGGGDRLRFEERMLRPADLRRWLGERLVASGGRPMDTDELIEQINEGPKRIVVLEGCVNLFLATVNGYRALAELGPIIDGTRRQVFWVMTMRGLAWNHLRAAGKELAFLRRKIVLEAWEEEQLTALIDLRLEQAGFTVSYADLLAIEGREEDKVSRDRLGKLTYFNFLADYSAGNPQIALHFFLRSLEVDGGEELKARPFDAPAEETLLSAGTDTLFLLAALVRHCTLDVRQAATTTDYPHGRVAGLFLNLLDMGAVQENAGVYKVATNWRATVLQVLRRHNILIS